MSHPPAIEAVALRKVFGSVVAVDSVDLAVARGSTTALLGGNGAGKTTTIAMLLGLVEPSSGVVRLLGQDMSGDKRPALARANFSSPYVDLPHALTVTENLDIYGRLYGVKDRRARIAELARDLDFEHLLKRRVGTLSAGQKTRVALAKALINRPEALLLDEPTASLDPDTADRVRAHLERYRAEAGAAILIASHNMLEVERLADRVLMMKAGRIVDDGAPAALIAKHGRASLEEVFLDIARGRAGAMEDA